MTSERHSASDAGKNALRSMVAWPCQEDRLNKHHSVPKCRSLSDAQKRPDQWPSSPASEACPRNRIAKFFNNCGSN